MRASRLSFLALGQADNCALHQCPIVVLTDSISVVRSHATHWVGEGCDVHHVSRL